MTTASPARASASAIFDASARWRFPFFGFGGAVKEFNLLNEAKLLAGEAYQKSFDNGTKRSLWTHIHEVENETAVFSEAPISERRHAMATLHELFEILDKNGKVLFTPVKVLARGFDLSFTAGLEALRRHPSEPYLAYIHRTACSGDMDAIVVKIADLRVNKRPRPYDGELPAKLQEKKSFLYPVSEAYLVAVYSGEINPRLVSPVDYLKHHPLYAQMMTHNRVARHYGANNVIRFAPFTA
jgi:hypothetical protein